MLDSRDVANTEKANGSSDLIVRTSGLTKQFSGFTAVSDVNLNVRRFSIHALIGPNGAGKTTLFNLLTRFLPPTAGQIFYNGNDVTALRPAELARRGMVRSFQISAIFPQMTVRDNVRIAMQRKLGLEFKFWRTVRSTDILRDQIDQLLLDVGLIAYADELAGRLPYGRKRALEVATTLALDPELLLLDEPIAGMDTRDVDRVKNLIKTISVGRTIVIVEHNISVVAEISDHVTVLSRGSILAEGDYATVSRNPKVMEAYLGVSADEVGHG